MPNCLSCGSETVPDANFCGRCGVKLKPIAEAPVAACRCGAGPESIDAAGFCEECGVRQIDAAPEDHEEQEIDVNFAGVTDRGRRHPINEDAIGIAEAASPSGLVRLLVVCDGVSTASEAARASAAAVEAFTKTALVAAAAGDDLAAIARRAADAAQDAVLSIPYANTDNAPATTLVAALVRGRRAVIVWAGDSRAYLSAPTPAQLTRDDSWFNDIVESGALTPRQARAHKYAHAIVKSLGALAEREAFAPNVLEVELPERARLLLCSDGLWNYAEAADELAKLSAEADSALETCRRLVAFANSEGGHDNISAVLLRSEVNEPVARP
jgi:serine/threonine protein phosphatase PrpC